MSRPPDGPGDGAASAATGGATLLYGAAVFVASFLLFSVEPMAAKLLLPRFGGGASIWATCLLFFQLALLAGYAYSHFIGRLGGRRQLVLHGVVVLLSLLALPVAVRGAEGAGPHPELRLLMALAAAAGAPFFLLATASTLLQRWYAGRRGRDPYFLYAGSNGASVAALVAYPLLVERRLGLRAQGQLFSLGYLGFVLLLGAAMAVAWRSTGVLATARAAVAPARHLLRWGALSFIGSLLLSAVTLRITTDVASVPLLWLLPLALYLMSFVLAFTPRLEPPGRALDLLSMAFVTVAILPSPWLLHGSLPLELAAPLGALFFGAWLCHRELWRQRPQPPQLSAFYMAIAVGGAVGGGFANLLAPLLFDRVVEYPLALGLVAWVVALRAPVGLAADASRVTSRLGAALLIALLVGSAQLMRSGTAELRAIGQALPLVALATTLVALRRPSWFLAACVGAGALALLGFGDEGQTLARRRGFFGVLRVVQGPTQRRLYHGTTEHGVQITVPATAMPGGYYHAATPMGRLLLAQPPAARIGVVGLGTGALAALTRPGQQLTFFEIDAEVAQLARRWFSFLDDARAATRIVVGDARLTLAATPEASFDLLIIDAFASDAVPVHLLTREAFAGYLRKLAPGGVLLVHASNRYFDLVRVVHGAAQGLGLADAVQRFAPDEMLSRQAVAPSTVVAVATARATLERLPGVWASLAGSPRLEWTDDRSSVIDALLEFAPP